MTKTSYDSPGKRRRRADVFHAFVRIKEGSRRSVRIVYLDGPEAEATRFFLSKGVDAPHLEPVNHDRAACKRILAETGVRATHDDIFHAVSRARSSVLVWLDLETRAVSDEAFASVAARANGLMIDVPCRQTTSARALRNLKDLLKSRHVRRRIDVEGEYRGRTEHTRMAFMDFADA